MAKVRRDGFTKLTNDTRVGHTPFGVNILFVHGLGGHPRETWEERLIVVREDRRKSEDSKLRKLFGRSSNVVNDTRADPDDSKIDKNVFWPQDYLVVDMPEARVWTYGYSANVVEGLFTANSQNSISQHGRNLAVRLERDIDNEEPIIFVAHSLGGIIVKDALRRSSICRMRAKFIIFLGTPHRGSEFASWGQIASRSVSIGLQDSNVRLLRTLEVNSEVLENIHEEFVNLVHESDIKIYSFQEGRPMTGIKGLNGKVVDDFSSKLDLHRQLETV